MAKPDKTEAEMIARGMVLFEQCYNGVVALPTTIEPNGISGLSMKMFNDVWGDGKLSFREKRLVVLGTLAGLGADPLLFSIHARSALRNGEITPEDLHAVIIMALPYVGYPRISPLYRVVEAAIEEHEKVLGMSKN